MILRAAQPLDAGGTGAILSAFARDMTWMPKLHSGAEDIGFLSSMIDRGWVRVAEENRQILGFLAREGEALHALYVRSDGQGHGVGTALIEDAKTDSARLSLWTFQQNVRAQRFYERHGFRVIDRTDGAENDEGLPDMCYLWEREAG